MSAGTPAPRQTAPHQTGPPHRTAAVLAIGDELTLGQRVDTNSAWLSAQLLDRGVEVVEHATVADDLPRLTDAFVRLAKSVDLIVATGGLGPTADDLTRQALADAAGDELVTDERALADVRAWFESSGRAMPERNAVQALRPSRGACLHNEHGTAPGVHMVIGACDVVCLPGPPREMKPMGTREMDRVVRPDPGRRVLTRALPTFGMGESAVAQRLGELMDRDRNPVVGTTASAGIVTCRLRLAGDASEDAARAQLDELERAVRGRLGAAVLGSEDTPDPLVEAVGGLLRERGQTVACAESCTGGMVGEMLTRLPGSSAWFVGGALTYSNDAKARSLGVDPAVIEEHGAVSAPVVRAMAAGALERFGADHALAVSGVAGPGGGSDDKPVGTVWIGLAAGEGSGGLSIEARRFRFSGDRGAVRRWSASCALAMLRLRLMGEGMTLIGEVERLA